MAKSKDYLKKSYDSADWKPISKSQIAKELVDEDLKILEEKGRIKRTSLYTKKHDRTRQNTI